MKSLEDSASKNKSEHSALLRTLLRGSKRRKRALRSELNSGSFRRALSEDEDDNAEDQVLEEMELMCDPDPMVQSEYNFPSSMVVPSTDFLQERLRGLHVSDHPRLSERQRNAEHSDNPSPKPEVRVRRNSAGDETMLFCDFGDFNTQELISSPVDFDQESHHGGGSHAPHSLESHTLTMPYSTQSESSNGMGLPMLQRPIPFSPAPQIRGPPPVSNFYQNMSFGPRPPMLPPKSHIPPPYRPPPHQQQQPHPFLNGPRPHFDEEHFSKGHSLMGGAFSSSDGGSHDSHNDSGYCAVRGSGGPSPSLSGNFC